MTDATGNSVTQTVVITVLDNTNPTISCPTNSIVVANQSGEYTVQGTEFAPAATDDNCGVASTVNDVNSSATLDGETLAVGTHTITWTVTDDNGNTTDCSFDVQVDAYTGINNTISENGISLYPNPAENNLQLVISNVQLSIKDIEILDITGKVCKTNITVRNNNLLTIDVSKLRQGVYFVKLTTNNTNEILRFIKE